MTHLTYSGLFCFSFSFLNTERIDERNIKAPTATSKCRSTTSEVAWMFWEIISPCRPPIYWVKVEKCASFVDVCKFTTFCDRKGYTSSQLARPSSSSARGRAAYPNPAPTGPTSVQYIYTALPATTSKDSSRRRQRLSETAGERDAPVATLR